MSGYIEGVDREQVTLFPERLEDWIGEDHVVSGGRQSIDQNKVSLINLPIAKSLGINLLHLIAHPCLANLRQYQVLAL